MAAGAVAGAAHAQYFGGNKLRYENPEFRILETEHFDIYTYREEDANAAEAGILMERWNQRIGTFLDHTLTGRQPLILYAGHPHFRQTNATPGEISEGTGGFTEMFKRRIVLPLAGVPHDTDHVLGHELAHAFQFDISRAVQQEGGSRGMGMLRLPLWFIEGMAEYLSIGSSDPQTVVWMRDAVANDDLPTIEKLDSGRYFPYRYGHAFWAYVGGRFGDAAVGQLLRSAYRSGDLRRSIRSVLGVTHDELSKDWQQALKDEFGPAVANAKSGADYGRALVPAIKGKGSYNLAPVLSPDGKRMLFFSEREQFSIELYVLDVESGKVLRRLTEAVTDPHLDSLQFLSSAGTWSPDGKRVAIGGVGRGRPMITIIDADTGETVSEHRFPELVEVLHPAWSPDGKRIAFAGNKGGVLQLHDFELATGATRVLVPGPFSSQQPTWSPDGSHLVFVTERFTSDAEQRIYGEFRLAQYDMATGAITQLPGLPVGKNSNPQFTPDGRKLYFLSDAHGGSNLYRLDLASGAIEMLTDFKSGISGITRMSPALSVASQAPDRIAVNMFEKDMYGIYLLDKLEPKPAPATTARIGQLPPRERYLPEIDTLLASRKPSADSVMIEGPKDYEARLGIDAVGQIGAVVGGSNVGTFVGGGIALQWSDMLGDHNLTTLAQVEGDTSTWDRNTSALVDYENRENRLRWGVGVSQYPNLSIGYQSEFGTYGGEPALRERLIRNWQINRQISGHVGYPFSRNDRVEASVGYRKVEYVTDALEQIYSVNTGQLLAAGVSDLPSQPSVDLYPLGLAYVHDAALFGGTAPISGQRYRIEIGGMGGDVPFLAPLVDFRQYYSAFKYLSLGARGLYYGRYGGGAEDPRLGDVFVGSWTLVRGYQSDSFGVSECDPNAAPACPVFDQLFGSHLAVASAEARVPILGARGLLGVAQAPPVDIAAFYDTGVAWRRDQEASFLGGPREPVSSYGVSMRVNFFGAFVLQWNYVNPIDRPEKGWTWEFLIAPGF